MKQKCKKQQKNKTNAEYSKGGGNRSYSERVRAK